MSSSFSAPIVAIGELLWDLLPSGPRLGGTTTNFAVLCARLGQFSALASRVGNDALGRKALQQLRETASSANFNAGFVQTSTTLPTGTVSVTLDADGRPQYGIDVPVAWDEIELSPQLLELAGLASVVCFGTLAQRRSPSCESIHVFVQATAPACVRVCDVNLRMPFCTAEKLRWSLQHATLLKVSDEELPEVARLLDLPIEQAPAHNQAEALTRWAADAASSLLTAAAECRLVAITLGPHGSLLADRAQTHRHLGFPVTVADTIGAGDAFTAGLVHGYLAGASLAGISTAANLCGSYVASQQGATPELPTKLLAAIRAALS